MVALRSVANVYLIKTNIGWVFGWFAALTLYEWTDFAWGWRIAVGLGFAFVAGVVSEAIGRCD